MVQEGLIIMVVGMLTVFLFLIVLVLLMQAMSKILLSYPGRAPLIQKDSNEANEQIAALFALTYHQSQTQKTNNSEVGK